jgi:hypothetical protein
LLFLSLSALISVAASFPPPSSFSPFLSPFLIYPTIWAVLMWTECILWCLIPKQFLLLTFPSSLRWNSPCDLALRKQNITLAFNCNKIWYALKELNIFLVPCPFSTCVNPVFPSTVGIQSMSFTLPRSQPSAGKLSSWFLIPPLNSYNAHYLYREEALVSWAWVVPRASKASLWDSPGPCSLGPEGCQYSQ